MLLHGGGARAVIATPKGQDHSPVPRHQLRWTPPRVGEDSEPPRKLQHFRIKLGRRAAAHQHHRMSQTHPPVGAACGDLIELLGRNPLACAGLAAHRADEQAGKVMLAGVSIKPLLTAIIKQPQHPREGEDCGEIEAHRACPRLTRIARDAAICGRPAPRPSSPRPLERRGCRRTGRGGLWCGFRWHSRRGRSSPRASESNWLA